MSNGIEQLILRGVGPADPLTVDFADRVNIICGDNGMGKSFLLDALWLAAGWDRQGHRIVPLRRSAGDAIPLVQLWQSRRDPDHTRCEFNWETERWSQFHTSPGDWRQPLTVYLSVSGSISVFDPLRHHGGVKSERAVRESHGEPTPADQYSQSELLHGLRDPRSNRSIIKGLIDHWIEWETREPDLFKSFVRVLQRLSEGIEEPLRPGKPMRVSKFDDRLFPTIQLPYGPVPITQLSAGMLRILCLAYAIVWAWNEHRQAAKLMAREVGGDVLLLIDEVESHLHPKWQRMILPAILEATEELTGANVQVIATTHSPLIPASVETLFDPDRDRLIHLKLVDKTVVAEKIPFAKQGDVVNWLVSESFGLKQGRSIEAESAIEEAEAFMRGATDSPEARNKIHMKLQAALPGHDEFWARWIVSTGAGLR